MNPQTQDEQRATVDQLFAAKAGVPPQQAQAEQPAPAPQQAPPQAQAPQGPPPEAPTTPAEKTEAEGSPKTEGDQMDEEPVLYTVKRGEEEVQLTPQQLRGLYDRYERMVEDYSQYGAFNQFGREVMKHMPPGTKPEQAIKLLMERANQHNPQMGGDPKGQGQELTAQQAPSNADIAQQLEDWEKENAVSLPPGYKEAMAGSGQMAQEMAQLKQMLTQVLAQSAGMANAAKTASQGNINQAAQVQKQRIDNNLREVLGQAGMGEEDANAFKIFAAERGYTPIDFASKNLVRRLAQDFQAVKQTPQLQQLLETNRRRQAFTGRAVGATPQQGGGAPDAPPGPLADMIEQKMRQRFN